MINTVIIDAQKQDRDRIAALISAGGDINILARGKDGYDALKLIGSLKPDIAIMNDQLEFIGSYEIPPLLKARSPSTMVVMLTTKISDYQLYKAASNRVSGFVNKETDMDKLPGIIKFISEGGCFISPALAARVLNLFSIKSIRGFNTQSPAAGGKENGPVLKIPPREDPTGCLSKMELRILFFISEGMDSNVIAGKLGLAAGTVRNYISSIMRKTGLENRSQMVRYAFNSGLILPGKNNVLPFQGERNRIKITAREGY